MKRLFTTVFAGCIALAGAAAATPISYLLTLEQDTPGVDTITGSFSLDDSLLAPNVQINFDQFDSFNITVAGITYTLADAARPDDEGVLTDGAGEVFQFADNTGSLTEFCSGTCGTFLRFDDGSFNYDTQGGNPSPTSGTYSITRQQLAAVPLPAAFPLLLVGLGGFGVMRRRAKT